MSESEHVKCAQLDPVKNRHDCRNNKLTFYVVSYCAYTCTLPSTQHEWCRCYVNICHLLQYILLFKLLLPVIVMMAIGDAKT